MASILYGERIASGKPFRLGTAAVLFEAPGSDRILLTRRADNGLWCLPGGALEPGESVAEGCAREVLEETGLTVTVKRLIGVYSDPHMLLTYGDGQGFHLVAFVFEVERVAGEPGLSAEVSQVGWFDPTQAAALELMSHHRVRLADAWARHGEAVVR